jgi:hypothetical protein
MISSGATVGVGIGASGAVGRSLSGNASVGGNVGSGGTVGASISSEGEIYGGGSGNNADMERIKINVNAGQALGGQRVVMVVGGDAFYYDETTDASMGATIGMTNAAASMGANVDVVIEGKVNSPGWGLTPGTVYFIASNGLISATPPASGVSLRVGVALDADTLLFKTDDEIFLN